MYLGAFWNGMGCFELVGCECSGDGCVRRFSSLEECQAVHARCDSVLCAATGGEFYPGHFCGPCGHYSCGLPTGDDCCDPGCNCGPGRGFVPARGCEADTSCTAEQACLASHGTWHPAEECFCGFTCGIPNDCDACLDSCNCGPHWEFLEAEGCVPASDPVCDLGEPEVVCTMTGGTWHDGDGGCGDFVCGRPNLLDPCVSPGCDCGPTHNFDRVQGCTYAPQCLIGEVGDECTGNGMDSTCRPGLACCPSCGMRLGCTACQDPCCPGSPGCIDGCPPPPP
jgi:hypothetical protein